MLNPTPAGRTTIPTPPGSPGAITAFARFHHACEAGDYRAAKRFQRELRRSFRYSVVPLGPSSAHPAAQADEGKGPRRLAAPRASNTP